MEKIYKAYIDGSYKENKAAWAFAIISQDDTIIYEEVGLVEDQEAVEKIWNVAAEITAAMRAIQWAVDNLKKIDIVTDYQGIVGWSQNWKTKNIWSANYADFVKKHKAYINDIIYVRGHTNNKWNIYVDKLAYNQLQIRSNYE